ncbi:unnamed protein product [Closterium sp. NIES-53]
MAERQCKTTVKALRTDRGGEFLGHDFTLFLDEKGIIHDLTCPYTPEQNGMAEREMRSIAVWVRNHVEHASLPSGVMPYELAFQRKPDVSMVRVWGCMLQYMVPQSQRGGKLAPKTRWGLHLGVLAASKGWQVLDLESNRLITTVEAVFYETMSLAGWKAWHQQENGGHPMPYEPLPSLFLGTLEEEVEEGEVLTPPAMTYVSTSVPTPPPPTVYPRVVRPTAPPPSSPPLATPPPVIPSPLPPSILPAPALPSSSSSTAPLVGKGGTVVSQDGGHVLVSGTIIAPPLRRSTRITRGVPPVKYAWAVVIALAGLDDEEEDEEWTDLDPDVVADPERQWDIAKMTVKEALGLKGNKVKEAMDEEMGSLIEQGMWELVPRPRGVNVVKSRWILNTKFRPDGIVEREKARLVVKGFTQVAGVDYEETYAPVGSYVTVRVLLAIVAALDLDLVQLDVKNAFLHGVLDRDLYTEQPSYYEDGSPRVCKLVKSLYGLKQSPMLWYEALDGVLLGAGLKKSQVDEALYFKSDAEGEMCWLLVFVDELLAASRSQSMLGELHDLLHSAFQLREISPVEKYLGLQLCANLRGCGMAVSPGGGVQAEGGILEVRGLYHPSRHLVRLQQVGVGPNWKELDRCLAYLVGSRDVALEFGGGPESLELVGYADADDAWIASLAPGRHRKVHLEAAKRVLRYLCSTSGMGLVLGGRGSVVLTGHSDASWADDQTTHRSTQGYIFSLGAGSVSWRSTRSSSVLSSSCEAEIYAGAMAAQELRWLTYLLIDLGEQPHSPPVLYINNKAMIALCQDQRLEHKTKHIALRYFLMRELQQRGQLHLAYVATQANTVDVFTKALGSCDHQRFCTTLGLVPTLPHLLCLLILPCTC